MTFLVDFADCSYVNNYACVSCFLGLVLCFTYLKCARLPCSLNTLYLLTYLRNGRGLAGTACPVLNNIWRQYV